MRRSHRNTLAVKPRTPMTEPNERGYRKALISHGHRGSLRFLHLNPILPFQGKPIPYSFDIQMSLYNITLQRPQTTHL